MNSTFRLLASVSFALLSFASMHQPTEAQPTETQPVFSDCASKAIASGDTAMAKINDLGRARNLARQTAEAANGGLGEYRTDASMHGRLSDAVCVDNGNGSWTFTIKGGAPGFVTPTVETAVTVDSSTWQVKVDYNGTVRSQ
ncbi:MAG: hypothetical protein LH647_13955 [Leptolyngbyaceae cyanobacterium CAN_BIN12]|nr:hypothetical protein [Leptolyngbyaceae cyanobacterium CAN_BIN12]